jgi:hypothetical protein
LKPGRYGVAVQSYADARVDFILHRDGSVQNITQWDELMQAPCGTYYGPRCPDGRRSQTQWAVMGPLTCSRGNRTSRTESVTSDGFSRVRRLPRRPNFAVSAT